MAYEDVTVSVGPGALTALVVVLEGADVTVSEGHRALAVPLVVFEGVDVDVTVFLAVPKGADVDVTVSDGQSAVTVQLESINPCYDCEEYFMLTSVVKNTMKLWII